MCSFWTYFKLFAVVFVYSETETSQRNKKSCSWSTGECITGFPKPKNLDNLAIFEVQKPGLWYSETWDLGAGKRISCNT